MSPVPLLIFAAVLLSFAAVAPASEISFVLVQPGYPGTTEDAAPFVRRLGDALSGLGAPATSGGEYHNQVEAGVQAVARPSTRWAIVSLGFFLEQRDRLRLECLAAAPEEPFHVVVRKDTVSRLGELAGKTVTGTVWVEQSFVQRILFPRGEAASWKTQPVKSFSKAIRDVSRGRRDAALLTHREYRGMERLRSSAELVQIHETARFPTAVVVSVGGRLEAEAATELTKALSRLGESDEGKEILEEMGIAGFGPVEAGRLERWQALYDKGPSTESRPR